MGLLGSVQSPCKHRRAQDQLKLSPFDEPLQTYLLTQAPKGTSSIESPSSTIEESEALERERVRCGPSGPRLRQPTGSWTCTKVRRETLLRRSTGSGVCG